ncbi:MAG: hypothetical protein B6D56_05525 [Candidatus Omnitrophica bacterium 4484_70.1]|nr:MAG: hypothetical protein B6D56_05525 [Candidatus Omnitrophica bacterium 4484_70.1]
MVAERVKRYIDEDLLYKYIIRRMRRDDIDFVAFAISHWHAVGVDSAVYNILKRKNKEPKGVIIICDHPKDGFIIKEKDFICKSFAEVEFCFLSSNLNSLQNQRFIIFRIYKYFRKSINLLRVIIRAKKIDKNKKWNNKKELIIISVRSPNISFLEIFKNKYIENRYKPVYFIIDEGFGTYVSKRAWKIVGELDNRKKLSYFNYLKNIEDRIRKEIINNFFKKLVTKYIGLENRFLLSNRNDKLIPNLSIVNSYKNIFLKRRIILLKSDNFKNIFSSAIILTSPFSEYKLATLEYELKILNNVVNILIQKGYNIIIKPHPREFDGKYIFILKKYKSSRVKVTHKDFPAEDLFCILNPLCVIGYTSTALITANIIFNLPVISVYRIFLNGNDLKRISILKKTGMSEFKKLTEGMVHNIDSFGKLENILDSIKSR